MRGSYVQRPMQAQFLRDHDLIPANPGWLELLHYLLLSCLGDHHGLLYQPLIKKLLDDIFNL
jgi:hypothetical protein